MYSSKGQPVPLRTKKEAGERNSSHTSARKKKIMPAIMKRHSRL